MATQSVKDAMCYGTSTEEEDKAAFTMCDALHTGCDTHPPTLQPGYYRGPSGNCRSTGRISASACAFCSFTCQLSTFKCKMAARCEEKGISYSSGD